jgi:hypothetical protein
MAEATSKGRQPIFLIKLVLVALGMANIQLFPGAAVDEHGESSGRAKLFAVSSIVLWAGAIATGRLMAYLKPL